MKEMRTVTVMQGKWFQDTLLQEKEIEMAEQHNGNMRQTGPHVVVALPPHLNNPQLHYTKHVCNHIRDGMGGDQVTRNHQEGSVRCCTYKSIYTSCHLYINVLVTLCHHPCTSEKGVVIVPMRKQRNSNNNNIFFYN